MLGYSSNNLNFNSLEIHQAHASLYQMILNLISLYLLLDNLKVI